MEEEDDDGNKIRVYEIKYEDGAEEKNAQRAMIRVPFDEDRAQQRREAEEREADLARQRQLQKRLAQQKEDEEEMARVQEEMDKLQEGFTSPESATTGDSS